MEQLRRMTNQLLDLTIDAETFYVETVKKKPDYEVDFYGKVKPFADQVQPLAQEWYPLAKAFLINHPTRGLHVNQLAEAVENLDVVAIKSFYASSGMKRQRETFKSVRYVLSNLLEELPK
ncbi:DUF1798 family protein [Shouchella patagoniensis]|uniref:DUF1798 family protein n=1 Tax=Shouchella patagoniensis TaxID=228576 RepID=UPI000994FBE4|nr:DUF1798 family protein [Shouchella patagoniensis]